MATVAAGNLATEPVAVLSILTSWGFEVGGAFSLESLVALALYDIDPDYGPGFFNLGGAGWGVPKNFPGAGFLPAGPPGSYWACVDLGAAGGTECKLYF